MSWTTATRAKLSPIGTLAAAVGAAGGAVVEALRGHARCRAGVQAMAQLDDHLLRDIGLTRAEIRAAAFGRSTPPHA